MRLTVQLAGKAVSVELDDEATPDDLRTAIQDLTGVLARNQKLLHKGRVLPAHGPPRATAAAALAPKRVTLASLGVGDGAKLMLLASGGAAGAGTAGSAALAASRAATAAAAAARRAGVAGGGPGPGAPPQDWPARAAAWAKTGVIALRDAGLTALPAEALSPAVAAAATAADVGGNPGLAALPPSFACLGRLTRLRLSGCGLSDLPDTVGQLTRLETALLYRCRLKSVPRALRTLPHLKTLSLSHNPGLASLDDERDDAPAWPPALEVLDVSHCGLRALPASLAASCPRLAALDARHNAIGPSLPANLGRVSALRLDANRVEALPPGFLGGPGAAVAVLSLQNNPITAETLRASEGYAAYDARRLAAANKRVASRTIGEGGGSAFQEGADAVEWCRWGPQ